MSHSTLSGRYTQACSLCISSRLGLQMWVSPAHTTPPPHSVSFCPHAITLCCPRQNHKSIHCKIQTEQSFTNKDKEGQPGEKEQTLLLCLQNFVLVNPPVWSRHEQLPFNYHGWGQHWNRDVCARRERASGAVRASLYNDGTLWVTRWDSRPLARAGSHHRPHHERGSAVTSRTSTIHHQKNRRGDFKRQRRWSALYLPFHNTSDHSATSRCQVLWKESRGRRDALRRPLMTCLLHALQVFIMIFCRGKQGMKKKMGFDGPTVCCHKQSLFCKLLGVKKRKGKRNDHNFEAWGFIQYVTDSL